MRGMGLPGLEGRRCRALSSASSGRPGKAAIPTTTICAALGVKLAAEQRRQRRSTRSCLYQGKGLPWIFYRASTPLAENGQTMAHEVRLSAGDFAAWLKGALGAGSLAPQIKARSALLPGMVMTVR